MTDLSNKRIIMIHGLASKPSAADLHKFWKRCLLENLRIDDPQLGAALAKSAKVIKSAYWANAVPHHIEDDADYVANLSVQVDRVIEERRQLAGEFHVGTGAKVRAFFKSRGLDVVNVFSNALTIKDDVMKMYLREVELYAEDQYIADRMRQPIETALRDAWSNNCEVAILSHSMGTFIAYDVLWRFSHRNVKNYREFQRNRVRMFVTMGSPLGDNKIRDLIFARHHKEGTTRHYPTNIDYWHNYASLGDVVSHDHDFKNAFFKAMWKIGLLNKKNKWSGIDYTKLHNPFVVVTHSGNKRREKRNPHKSYGYLVQPRLGTWVRDFLRGDLK